MGLHSIYNSLVPSDLRRRYPGRVFLSEDVFIFTKGCVDIGWATVKRVYWGSFVTATSVMIVSSSILHMLSLIVCSDSIHLFLFGFQLWVLNIFHGGFFVLSLCWLSADDDMMIRVKATPEFTIGFNEFQLIQITLPVDRYSTDFMERST